MICLQLFFVFLQVGAFTFGGGYAMISLIRNSVISYGWMTEEEFLNFLGVETVIPGPIAVNMATYIGYEQAGFLGALLATIGIVLPSFIIILLIATVIKNMLKYQPVKVFIASIRPTICGLILSVVVTLSLTVFFGIDTVKNIAFSFDWREIIILALIVVLAIVWKHFKKKNISSVLLIAISGILGIIFFEFL